MPDTEWRRGGPAAPTRRRRWPSRALRPRWHRAPRRRWRRRPSQTVGVWSVVPPALPRAASARARESGAGAPGRGCGRLARGRWGGLGEGSPGTRRRGGGGREVLGCACWVGRRRGVSAAGSGVFWGLGLAVCLGPFNYGLARVRLGEVR